jgi:hypothetical protein
MLWEEMMAVNAGRRRTASFWMAVTLALLCPLAIAAQPPAPGGGRGQPGASARAAAPVDLTGYWVSIVTEDWIERMSPESPPSGVVGGGRGGRGGGRGGAPQVTSTDPCRAYGAAGSMRVPTRLNVTWADDNTLRIDMDAGRQTRLLHFSPTTPPPAQRTLQGYSTATWVTGGGRGRGGRGGPPAGRGGAPAGSTWGSLTVTTTNMAAGYLLSSRSYYSENATLTEHVTRHSAFGNDYFTVTAIVQDGGVERITSSTFKKEPDGSKFSPSGCELVPST